MPLLYKGANTGNIFQKGVPLVFFSYIREAAHNTRYEGSRWIFTMKMELVRSYETSKAMMILTLEETEAFGHSHHSVE